MSSNSVIPQDDGSGFPLDTGLKIACLFNVIIQEFKDVLWMPKLVRYSLTKRGRGNTYRTLHA